MHSINISSLTTANNTIVIIILMLKSNTKKKKIKYTLRNKTDETWFSNNLSFKAEKKLLIITKGT